MHARQSGVKELSIDVMHPWCAECADVGGCGTLPPSCFCTISTCCHECCCTTSACLAALPTHLLVNLLNGLRCILHQPVRLPQLLKHCTDLQARQQHTTPHHTTSHDIAMDTQLHGSQHVMQHSCSAAASMLTALTVSKQACGIAPSHCDARRPHQLHIQAPPPTRTLSWNSAFS